MNNSQGLKTAWHLFWLQSLITVVLSIIFGLQYGREGIIAAWMGGLSAIVPAASSAQILFRGSFLDTPRQWLNRFKYSELMKLMMSFVISGLVFYWIDPLPGVMFFSWGITLMAYRIVSFGLKNKSRVD